MAEFATRKIFHIMLGTEGGTEKFFLRLTKAFAERGIEQQFAIRPKQNWRDQLAPLGIIHEGYFLRHTPSALFHAARLRNQIYLWNPDAVIAWRAPSTRLFPTRGTPARIVRLGDYPHHLRHFKNLDCIVGIAPNILTHCRELGWRGREEIISNFPPDTSAGAIQRSALTTPADVPLVCATGRFFHTKGFDTLLRAIASSSDLWLWLLGDGEERAELENLAAELGISGRVRMPGWVPNAADYVAASDVFCVPSRQEPLGNVLLEGWHSERPMVATRAEGANWAATDRQDCLLVEIDDAEAMARALSELAHTPDLARTLVEGGRKTLALKFSKQNVVDAYLSLIDDIQGIEK
ncbi:glycosyltransferase [Boseongicola sp. H5]|uniref:glycosyltransferase n=1 Tax=Boseongicola sp. H5 TaxID=2763261 RepID=UPI001D0B86F2